MSIEYTWDFELELDEKDVVIAVHWSCIATEDTLSGRIYGLVTFASAGEPFIDFSKLTEEDVKAWAATSEDSPGTEEQIKQLALDELNRKKTPKTSFKEAPWSAPMEP